MSRRHHPWRTVRTLLLILFAIFAIFIPLWIVVVNSLKPVGEANELNMNLPREWAVAENYGAVVTDGKLGQGFVNTLLVVVPSVVGIIIFGSMAAWIFGRGRSKRLSLLYYLSIAGVLIPPAIIASIQILRNFQQFGGRVELILFYLGVYMSFGIFLITGFIKTIPIELEEAARIDGAGPVRIFFRIILPLLRPILVTAAFILLLFTWNDFFYASFFVGKALERTMTLGLFNFVSGFYLSIRWNLVFASVVLMSLPLVLFFALAQRWIVSGLMGVGVDK